MTNANDSLGYRTVCRGAAVMTNAN